MSKETIVQGDICLRRILSKIVRGHFMSKDTFVQETLVRVFTLVRERKYIETFIEEDRLGAPPFR